MTLPTEHWRPPPSLPRRLPQPGSARRLNAVLWGILLLLLLVGALSLRPASLLAPLPQSALAKPNHPISIVAGALLQLFSAFIAWGLVAIITFYAAMAVAGFGVLANLVAGLRCWQAGQRGLAAEYLAGLALLATLLLMLWSWC